jgi:hypothetical protein
MAAFLTSGLAFATIAFAVLAPALAIGLLLWV